MLHVGNAAENLTQTTAATTTAIETSYACVSIRKGTHNDADLELVPLSIHKARFSFDCAESEIRFLLEPPSIYRHCAYTS